MKKAVAKYLVFVLAGLALLCFVLSFALLKKTARAETPESPCTGNHSGWTEITSSSETVTLASGNYFLADNVKLTPEDKTGIIIPGNAVVTICLNGNILLGGQIIDYENVILVEADATLNLCDCGTESKHYFNRVQELDCVRWKFVDDGENFLDAGEEFITGGTIARTTSNGNAIEVKGTLNLFSGSVSGSSTGVGVSGENAEFNMYGGAISGNSAHGGVQAGWHGTFNLYSGSIYENYSNNSGGGVTISDSAVFNMSGGSIYENHAEITGSGVDLNKGEFNLSGGSIVNNFAKGRTGGQDGYAVFFFGNPKNTAINVSGSPKVTGNRGRDGVPSNNIHLYNNDGTPRKITVVGELGADAELGVWLQQYSKDYVVTDGANNSKEILSAFHSDNEHYNLYLNGDGEIAFTDEWGLTLNLYKDGNGKYVTDGKQTSYPYGEAETTLREPTRGGYDFAGWYESEDFSGEAVTTIPANSYGNKTYFAKWNAVPENNLFGGENVKFGKHNLWDSQRIPAFPNGNAPFYIYGLSAPLDVRGERVTFGEGDYVQFVPYVGADADGDGTVTVSELPASDRDRIVDTLLLSSNSNRESILNARIVSEVKYDQEGRAETLAETGLIWALGEVGFLYTALDPDCGWSWSGGVGTFVTFSAYCEGDGLEYVPDSPDPVGGGEGIPVPTPEVAEKAERTRSVLGVVVDGEGAPVEAARVLFGNENGDSYNVSTDPDGYFMFENLSENCFASSVTLTVTSGSYAENSYFFDKTTNDVTQYEIVRLVYLRDGSAEGAGGATSVGIRSVRYLNMDGATPGEHYPISYTEGVGAPLSDPTKSGYLFGGWYQTEDFSDEKITEISSEARGDLTLYAKWIVPSEPSEIPQTPQTPQNPQAPEAPEREQGSLLWLIILLAVILAGETAALVWRLCAVKRNEKKSGEKTGAVLPLILAAYPAGEIVAVCVLAAAVVAVGIALACSFLRRRKQNADESETQEEDSDDTK